ncbi:MAG: superinfection immunity protein [Phycisphaerales bacterium]|nr:MAG: superinfection immunity protein [Phycisphaerales bacterium]
MTLSDEEVRKGIQEELGPDTSLPDANYESREDVDPDALWKRAQACKQRRRSSQADSWGLVFGVWVCLQALPALGLILVVLVGLISEPSRWAEALFGSMTLALVWACLTLLYWLPTLIAHRKNRTNKWAITLLNFLTGWLFIGWVISIVWAVSEDKGRR